ncbi:hypothetical protein ANTPLA_LOCUS261 [Anthophora plagiata]
MQAPFVIYTPRVILRLHSRYLEATTFLYLRDSRFDFRLYGHPDFSYSLERCYSKVFAKKCWIFIEIKV